MHTHTYIRAVCFRLGEVIDVIHEHPIKRSWDLFKWLVGSAHIIDLFFGSGGGNIGG